MLMGSGNEGRFGGIKQKKVRRNKGKTKNGHQQ